MVSFPLGSVNGIGPVNGAGSITVYPSHGLTTSRIHLMSPCHIVSTNPY